MKHLHLLMLVVLLAAACTPAPTATQGSETTAPATSNEAAADLLADIQARGVLRISTDPAYPPQSELVEGVEPPADTKCSGEEKPANQFTGFDVDVAVELAKRLGVEACFVTPDWTLIVGGNWAGRWDISIGSVTITPERMKVLYFGQPYYTTPAAFFVHADSSSAKVEDLSGKTIGACSGCTYESYLNGNLEIPGETIHYLVQGATVNGYDTDTSALQDLALGNAVRLDAVLTAQPTGQGFINDGQPLKQLGDPVYFEYLAPAIDRGSSLDTATFLAKVTESIQAMHSDGALKTLSEKYYGADLATPAASFDLSKLGQ
jgi:polar amino acid transport system substrate-binding protein